MSESRPHRSACPKCNTRMTLARVAQGPEGFEHQSFECRSCDHAENVVVALDPLNPNSLGWLAGELGASSITSHHANAISHEIHQGRMILKPAE
jgi:hypothetical protein